MSNLDTNINFKNWNNVLNFHQGDTKVLPFKLDNIVPIRKAFGKFTKDILEEQKKVKRSDGDSGHSYYDFFKKTSNGKTIVNPKFEVIDGNLSIKAEVGFYESYHAFNGLRNGLGNKKIDFNNEVDYKVLSAGVVMYHQETNFFFFLKDQMIHKKLLER